ncbi:MAG: hypothetical protein HQL26_09535 [Candidatus Omnitrophica bacterium]|nr:hypothetical protein [Candidatus Omnitrophota bacterium]
MIKTKISIRIIFIVFAVLVLSLTIYLMVDNKNNSITDQLIAILMNAFCMLGVYAIFNNYIEFDNIKIACGGTGVLNRKKELYWYDIEKIEGAYIVSVALLRLIPYSSSGKKTLDIPIESFPKKAMAEILNHAPKDCQFHFDRYTQKYVDKVKKEMQQSPASSA